MRTIPNSVPSILLVEDDPDDVLLFRRALGAAGADDRVLLATDGDEAIRLLRERKGKAPSLVLLDLNLPRMNGFEFLDEVRNDDELRALPVIVLTSSRSDDDVVESYARQANAFVRKPSTLEGFRRLVESVDGFWLRTATLPSL